MVNELNKINAARPKAHLKTTPEQFELLKKELSKYPEMMDRNASNQLGLVNYNRIWNGLVLNLNDMGPPRRNTAAWKKVWSDLRKRKHTRNYTAARARRTAEEREETMKFEFSGTSNDAYNSERHHSSYAANSSTCDDDILSTTSAPTFCLREDIDAYSSAQSSLPLTAAAQDYDYEQAEQPDAFVQAAVAAHYDNYAPPHIPARNASNTNKTIENAKSTEFSQIYQDMRQLLLPLFERQTAAAERQAVAMEAQAAALQDVAHMLQDLSKNVLATQQQPSNVTQKPESST